MSMFEKIRSQIQHRQYTKRKESLEKWTGNITPKIRDKLRKNTEFSRDVEVSPASGGVFGVESHGRDYVVELNMRACSCRRWQLTGIPCSHAIACMRHDRIKPESMVSSCYTLPTYMLAYGGQIFPLRDKDEWAPVDATPILPPLYEKSVGRRKKNRRKQPEESEDGTRLSKHGVTMHCGYCKVASHNRGGCGELKSAIIRENDVALGNNKEEELQQQEHAQDQQSVQQEEQAAAHIVPQSSKIKGKAPPGQAHEKGKNTSSRGRKRTQSNKMKEHVEHLLQIAKRKKSKQILDENGDIDFPVIRTHIHKQERADLHLKDSMVDILSREGPAQAMPVIVEEMPEESYFVAEHRANIPSRRGPLVNTSGRALGSRGTRGARGARGAKAV
ncbi:uncharacterized protein [Lolium perenne]|uniref:uncharacterized protein n=1 Tax=Lolium perenne TaxID=4522 RepID=UPI003A9A1AAF